MLYYRPGPGLCQQAQKCVVSESYYDIHEDEQNGLVTEGKNRGYAGGGVTVGGESQRGQPMGLLSAVIV